MWVFDNNTLDEWFNFVADREGCVDLCDHVPEHLVVISAVQVGDENVVGDLLAENKLLVVPWLLVLGHERVVSVQVGGAEQLLAVSYEDVPNDDCVFDC